MKTYILDTINRIKRYSEKLDVETSLCDKPWVVFNDTGDRELLIFKNDASVLITINGVGVKRKWEWVAANKSLIINQLDDTIIMLHPEYFNNSILALNRDGTDEYAFLIDDNKSKTFSPKTLSELNDYFFGVERKAIELEKEKRKREQEEEERKRKAEYNKVMMEKAIKLCVPSKWAQWAVVVIVLITLILVPLILFLLNIDPEGTVGLISCMLLFFVSLFVSLRVYFEIPKIKAKKYIKKHPDDPLNPYLKNIYEIGDE